MELNVKDYYDDYHKILLPFLRCLNNDYFELYDSFEGIYYYDNYETLICEVLLDCIIMNEQMNSFLLFLTNQTSMPCHLK
jgi:hypothetical protein